MEGIKVIMAALAGVFLAAVLKSVKSEMTMLVAAGVSVLILFYILSGLSVIVEQLKMLQGYIGISGKYTGILVKMIGISYMTQRGGGTTGGVLQDHDCRTGYAGGAYII